MPEEYPGAAIGGGDVLNGETYSALDVPQQRALVAFWAAPGEFLVRVTHPTFVKWLAPAGISFADPTAAGQSCAASHVLESLLLGACRLDPAVAGTAKDRSGETFVTPNTLAAALDALVCSEARLAAGTKVLIARGGEGAGTPFGWRADSQRKIPSRAVPKKGKRRQSRSKAKQKQKKHSQRTMGEAGGREQKGEAAASGERRRLGSVCAVRWAQRGVTTDFRRFPSLSLQTPRYTYCISRSLL